MSALSSQAGCGIDRHKCVALSCPVGVTIREFCWYFYPHEGRETLKRWNLSAAAGWLLQRQGQHKLTELVSRAERCWGNGGLASTFQVTFSFLLLSSLFCVAGHRRKHPWCVHAQPVGSWNVWTLNSVFQISGKWEELVGFFQLLRKICEDLSSQERTTNSTPHDPIGRGLRALFQTSGKMTKSHFLISCH